VDLILFGTAMSPLALIVILVIALIVFGKRLPEVARSLGKGIVEFKKGVRGIEDQIDEESSRPYVPPTQPKAVDAAKPAAGTPAPAAPESAPEYRKEER
jgi:sec-independent protein translocase protein TatA